MKIVQLTAIAGPQTYIQRRKQYMCRFKGLSSVDLKNGQAFVRGAGFPSSAQNGVRRLPSQSGALRTQDGAFGSDQLPVTGALLPRTGQSISCSASSILLPSLLKSSVALIYCLFFPHVLSGQTSRVPDCNKRGKTLKFWPEPVENPTK